MQRNCPLFLLTVLLAAGCGSTGFVYDEGEALRGASAPAAVPGFLGPLPAKEEGAPDPGEIREGELSIRWGVQVGMLVHETGGLDYWEDNPVFRAFFRLGADRANPYGIEFGIGYNDMPGASWKGEDVDTEVRDVFFRARGLFGVGPEWFYLTGGMQLVYEDVYYLGEHLGGHFGATLDLGMNFRLGTNVEIDPTIYVLLGSENEIVLVEIMFGLIF